MYRTLLVVFLTFILLSCQSDPEVSRDEYFESGQTYLQNNQLEEASIQLLNALKIDGGYIPARMLLADTYTQMGNLPAASAELKKIIEQEPDNIEARLKLARFFLLAAGFQGQQWYEEVRRLSKEVLEIDPGNADAHILLGNSFAGLREFDRSIEEFKNALETDPANLRAFLDMGTLALRRNNLEEAEKAFLEAVKNNPDSVNAHNALGSFYMAAGNREEGKKALLKAYELGPGDSLAIYGLVKFYLSEEDQQNAIQVLENAVSANPDTVEYVIDLANLEIIDGNMDRGMQVLEDAYQRLPSEPRLILRLAEVEYNNRSVERAHELVDTAIDNHPRNAQARLLKSQMLLQNDRREEALQLLDESIELNPRYTDALEAKSDLLVLLGRLSEAEQTARSALDLNQGSLTTRSKLAKLLALNSQSPDSLNEAIVYASRVLEIMPNNFDALVARAEANLKTGKLPAARRDFERLSEGRENNPFLLHRLGKVAAQEGRSAEALRLYRQALRISPDSVDGIRDLTTELLKSGDVASVIRELDSLSNTSSRKDVYNLYKGQIYLETEDLTRAEAEFRKAISLNPDNSQAYFALGNIYVQRNQIDQAIAEVDKLIEHDEKSTQAYLLKGYYLQSKGDVPGAIEAYRKVLDLASEGEEIWCVAANNIAWRMVVADQNLTEALRLAEKAREYQPRDPRFADTLGWVHYKMGNYPTAINQLLFAINQGAPTGGNYYRLGMAYYKANNPIQAKQSLRQALEISEDFDGVIEAREILRELENQG
jgi:tetratricopeptide (TPR) repeat protein